MKYYPKTFTVTIASPAVFTCTDHNLYPGDEVILFTTSALPTGLTATTGGSETIYYVIKPGLTTSTFQVSASKSDNHNATAVNTTGSQSGTHTFLKNNQDNLSPLVEDCK